MNKNMMIHESILGDIMDIIDDVKQMADNASSKRKPMAGMSSIAKATSNMTLVFPVICTRGISIENASMVSKAVERNAVSMLQKLLSAYNISTETDLMSYIQQFHKNVSGKIVDLDDIFRLAEGGLEPATFAELQSIKEDMKNLGYYLPTDINEIPLTAYKVHEGAVTMDFDTAKNVGRMNKDAVDYFNKQTLDSDFKKANELMPTNMVVNFTVVNDEGQKVDNYTSGVIGVKAKLYPVKSDDIVTHIADKTEDRNWLTNLFRASTRETSFIKDFILALNKARIDALSMSTKNNTSDKMWKVLERRASLSRLNRVLRSNNGAAAISTLCISQEEVEYLRKYKSIDVERIGVVSGLFESLNFMCICIVDEALEVAKFIFDENDPMWETISFTHLERESSDNTYKRVVNLMTKTSR